MLPTILNVLGGGTVAIAILAAVFVIRMRRQARLVPGPLRLFGPTDCLRLSRAHHDAAARAVVAEAAA
jgi:hypothetical protein